MFNIGSFKTKTCSGVNRRSFLKISEAIPFGLWTSGEVLKNTAARAKPILFVFLWGASRHLDTCDLKTTNQFVTTQFLKCC